MTPRGHRRPIYARGQGYIRVRLMHQGQGQLQGLASDAAASLQGLKVIEGHCDDVLGDRVESRVNVGVDDEAHAEVEVEVGFGVGLGQR